MQKDFNDDFFFFQRKKLNDRGLGAYRLLLLICFFSLFFSEVSAQDDADFRMEIGGALGGCFYLGDLNEKFYSGTGASAGVVWRYLYNPRNSLKTMLTWGKIKGDTKNIKNFYPINPQSSSQSTGRMDYGFSDSVVDLCFMYELNFWPYGYYQNYRGNKRLTPMLQFGLGLTYAGIERKVAGQFPLGLGVKYKLGKRWNLALDWLIHFTLSDRLDGLESPEGISSSGFKNKDSYQTTLITLTYSFQPICVACNKD